MNAARPLGSLGLVVVLSAGCGSDVTEGTGGSGSGGEGTTSTTTGSTTTSASTTSTSSGEAGGPGVGGAGSGTGGSGTGGSGTGGGGTGGGGTGGGGTGGGATAFADECAVDDDCPNGTCFELESGFRTCRFEVEETPGCENGELDACCASSECDADMVCTRLPDHACGGAPPNFHNECVPAEDDCAGLGCTKTGGTCIPSGVYGNSVAHCASLGCSADADCDAEAGGRCVPVFATCCSQVVGLFCAYPSDGCRQDQDCGADAHCAVDETGRARCAVGPGACPP